MNDMTRRHFVESVGILAAGAAAGKTIWNGIKEHGPVKIRMFFFTEKPIVFSGDLLSDELKNVFRIRCYGEEKRTMTAEIKLSEVKHAVAAPSEKIPVIMAMRDDQKSQHGKISLVAEDEKLTFLFEDVPGQKPTPVWLMLEDVKRVL